MSDAFNVAQWCPPSEYLQDEITERGWTEEELARRMGVAPSRVLALLSNDLTVDPEIAAALEKALGTSATLWLRLQERYTLGATDLR